ncbi:MAG: hypothetical protein ACRDY0_09295 [Acidimicrobiales bacterium]
MTGVPGAAETGATPAPGRRSTYMRSGLVALAVLVLAGLAVNFGLLEHRSPGILDGQVVAERISEAMLFNEGTAGGGRPDLRCPAHEPLRGGLGFDCTLVRPRPGVVRVTEEGDQGRFSFRVLAPDTAPGG